MSRILLDLLIIVCASLLIWGVVQPARIYQYPFFMSAIFTTFLIPQAFSLVSVPGLASTEAIERVLFFSCLCIAMCWVGYQPKPSLKVLRRLSFEVDENKLARAAFVLAGVGYSANLLLNNTTIQMAENGNWTGPATIYFFFAQVLFISFSIFLLQSLKKPNFANLALTAISALPIVNTIIFNGRRQPTMTFLGVIGLAFWMMHRRLPPRWLVVTAVLSLAFLIPVLGTLRGGFWDLLLSGDWQSVISSSQESFSTLLEGNVLELRNAAMLIDAAEHTGRYGYGTGIWDSIVFQFVPGQIVGYGVKEALQFNISVSLKDLAALYGYLAPNGATATGIGDSFADFSYLGCFIFALIGYLFKTLWISSVYYRSTFSTLMYMGLFSPAMLSLTHGTGRFFQEGIFQLIFIGLAVNYAKVKRAVA